jgi:hypothetical protein
MCQPKPAFQKPVTAEGGKWLHGKGRNERISVFGK